MTVKRIISSLLVLVFIGLVAWWLLYVPYHPASLYRAVPINAVYVSAHYDIASRDRDFFDNPLILSLASSMGIAPDQVRKLMRSRDFRQWLPVLASDELVLAHVPARGALPASWVFASWIGSRSQRLRWSLDFAGMSGVSRAESRAGVVIWQVESGLFPPGLHLSIAFEEGVLLGCLSHDALGVIQVLDTFLGRSASLSSFYNHLVSNNLELRKDAADRCCLFLGGPGQMGRSAFQVCLTTLEPSRIQGGMGLFQLLSVKERMRVPAMPEAPVQPDWDLPITYGLLRNESIKRWTWPIRHIPWVFKLRGLFESAQAEHILLAFFDGELSGRLMQIKVPGLLVGMPFPSQEAAFVEVNRFVDLFNAQYRLGLIPHEMTRNGQTPWFVIEGTSGQAYAQLPLEERVAFAYYQGWLLVAANPGTLNKVIGNELMHEGAGSVIAEWPHFKKPVTPGGDMVRMDIERSGQALKLALAGYSLLLMMKDPEHSRTRREIVNELKAWIDSAGDLRDALFIRRTNAVLSEVWDFSLGSGTRTDTD